MMNSFTPLWLVSHQRMRFLLAVCYSSPSSISLFFMHLPPVEYLDCCILYTGTSLTALSSFSKRLHAYTTVQNTCSFWARLYLPRSCLAETCLFTRATCMHAWTGALPARGVLPLLFPGWACAFRRTGFCKTACLERLCPCLPASHLGRPQWANKTLQRVARRRWDKPGGGGGGLCRTISISVFAENSRTRDVLPPLFPHERQTSSRWVLRAFWRVQKDFDNTSFNITHLRSGLLPYPSTATSSTL